MFQVVKPKKGEGAETSGRRRRKRATAIATTNRCNVEQIPNRDYTEPAYNIELDVNDDRFVIYFYHLASLLVNRIWVALSNCQNSAASVFC